MGSNEMEGGDALYSTKLSSFGRRLAREGDLDKL